jgi:hypothetical protein
MAVKLMLDLTLCSYGGDKKYIQNFGGIHPEK